METDPAATKPGDYLHIAGWGQCLGSRRYYIVDQQERAFAAGAPLNAIYEHHASDGSGPTGEWVMIDTCENADQRERIEADVKFMKKRMNPNQCRPELARADSLLSADELHEKYTTEHPQHLLKDWRREVEDDASLPGYWSWVEHQTEQVEV